MPTFSQTITSAANAFHWWLSNTNFGSDGTYVGKNSTTWAQDSSLLFTSVTVPKGASISSATLTIVVAESYGTPVSILYGNDVDSATAPTSKAEGAALTLTTASIDPSITTTGTKNLNVKNIVEEIITRAGWNKGNMQFVIKDNGSSSGAANYYCSDAIATYARTLTIVYSIGRPQILWF
jgi:hypothetical protein